MVNKSNGDGGRNRIAYADVKKLREYYSEEARRRGIHDRINEIMKYVRAGALEPPKGNLVKHCPKCNSELDYDSFDVKYVFNSYTVKYWKCPKCPYEWGSSKSNW